MHTSHDALWRPLGALGPSFILSPLKLGGPTRLRPSLFLALSLFRLLLLSSRLSLSHPPALPPSFSSAILSPLFHHRFLSSSFSLSPHYPTHNRTPRARKKDAAAFAPRCSFGTYTGPVSVCGFQLKRRSYEALRETLARLFLASDRRQNPWRRWRLAGDVTRTATSRQDLITIV